MDTRLSAQGLTLRYDQRVIARDLTLALPDGAFTVIVGPNACGKSTLLRALGRLMAPDAGQVVLDGRAITHWPTRDVARRLGMLPQASSAPDGITVSELVARGRFPHQSFLRQWSPADARALDHALTATGLTELADRPLAELSGGQRQRAWIAMVLAQDTPILLLDEPTTYLDLAHQIDLLDLLARLNTDGRTIVAVLHELNLAFRYADHVIAMRDGRVLAQGAPDQIVDEALIRDVFDLRAMILPDPVSGRPMVVPYGAAARAG